MNIRDSNWRVLAVLLSVLLHSLAAFSFAERQLSADVEKPKPSTTHVRLDFVPPSVPSRPQAVAAPEPKPQPAVEPPPDPKPDPKPKPKPQPKPKAKPKPKPEPKPEPKPKTEPVSKPVSKPKSVIERPIVAELVPEPVAQPIDPRPMLRKRYLAELLKRIEARKFYPRLARRKNIQGTVTAAFTLGCDGSVSKLDTVDSHKLLRKAAAKAVRAAQPLPKPPVRLDCPMLVRFAMEYRLE